MSSVRESTQFDEKCLQIEIIIIVIIILLLCVSTVSRKAVACRYHFANPSLVLYAMWYSPIQYSKANYMAVLHIGFCLLLLQGSLYLELPKQLFFFHQTQHCII